ncbi:MAG: Rpn family recombination-promoting nuclease/putative transposase [Lachnospiraceae bacterium]|nr:Rpn family recombination-promoting nuclease/putative transposase [Lachnospiraceae bacterium]
MSQKDITEKLLLDYNDIFSDIVNTLLLDGKETVDENSLVPTIKRSQFKADSGILHEIERDTAKVWKKGNLELVLIGIENQTEPEKYFPLRAIAYDGVSYRSQLISINEAKKKKTKAIKPYPVLTVVLYFGDDHWDYKKNLKGVLDVPNEFDKYINDYKVNVIEVAWLPDEVISKFKSDFRYVADYFAKKRIDPDYLPQGSFTIRHVDAFLKFLATMSGDETFLKIELEGDATMDKVGKRLGGKYIDQGIEQGIVQGIEQGKAQLILTMLESGKTPKEIADFCGIPLDYVLKVQEESLQKA